MRYCTLLCALIMSNVFERVLCEDFFDNVGDKIKGALVTGWHSVRDFFVTIQPTRPPPNRRKWRKRIWRLTTKKMAERIATTTMLPTAIPTLNTPSIQTTPEKTGAVKKHVPMIITPKWVSYKEWNQIQDSPENFRMRIGGALDVYRKYNFLRDWYVNKPWPASTSNNKNETSTSFAKEISSKENISFGNEAIVHAFPAGKSFIIRRPKVPTRNTTTNLLNSSPSKSGSQSARSPQLLSRTKSKILSEIIKLIAEKASRYTTDLNSNKTEKITTRPEESNQIRIKSAKTIFLNKNELKSNDPDPKPIKTDTNHLSVKKLNIEEIAQKLPLKAQEEILHRIADTLVANNVIVKTTRTIDPLEFTLPINNGLFTNELRRRNG